MSRQPPPSRDHYPVFTQLATRWDDNDIYGHLNNTVHYKLFDTAVNGWLLTQGLLDPHNGQTIFLVVETGCSFFAELTYPDPVEVGLRIARLGGSSVTYDIGLFAPDGAVAAARGSFVHVNVDRISRRPVPITDTARAIFDGLILPQEN
jgi:acyl-CoA thioester hydrolase